MPPLSLLPPLRAEGRPAGAAAIERGTLTYHVSHPLHQFDGQTCQYKQISFQRVVQNGETRITGTIPAKLTDFKIDPPTLLTMPIKNDIPVRVDLTWRPM